LSASGPFGDQKRTLDDEEAGGPTTDAKRSLWDVRIEPRVMVDTASGRNTRSRPPRQNPSVRRNASQDLPL